MGRRLSVKRGRQDGERIWIERTRPQREERHRKETSVRIVMFVCFTFFGEGKKGRKWMDGWMDCSEK